MMRWLYYLSFSMLFPGILCSSPFSVDITLSSSEVRLEEEFKINVTLRYPYNYGVDFKTLHANLVHEEPLNASPFSIEHMEIAPQELERDMITQKIIYTLAPWKTGKHKIHFLSIPFFLKENTSDVKIIHSDIYCIEVKECHRESSGEIVPYGLLPLEESEAFELDSSNKLLLRSHSDAKLLEEKLKENMIPRNIAWTIFLCFLAAATFFCAQRYVKRNKKKLFKALSPKERAIKSLDTLKNKDFPSKGLYERYFVALTGIIRFYLEEEYNIKAPERTTEEFLLEMTQSKVFSKGQKDLLEAFLFQADMVKFACGDSSIEECDKAIAKAYDIIQSTEI